MRLFTCVGLCLAMGLGHACTAKTCTEIGCSSGAVVNVSSIDSADVRQIRACLDGACNDLSWRADIVCADTNGGSPQLSVCPADGDSLELRVYESDVQDGDVLMIRIEGESAVLLEEERTLEYKDSYPNGRDCPDHCRIATVDL